MEAVLQLLESAANSGNIEELDTNISYLIWSDFFGDASSDSAMAVENMAEISRGTS